MLIIAQLNNLLAPKQGGHDDGGGPIVTLDFERTQPARQELTFEQARRNLRLVRLAALWADGHLTDDEFAVLSQRW